MNNLAFIDFEMNTNGDMSKSKLEIIEFGIYIYTKDGKLIKKERGFVKPLSSENLYEYTTFLTGITQEKMKNAISFRDMMYKLKYLTENCEKIYCWGDIDILCLKIGSKKYYKKDSWRPLLKKLEDYQPYALKKMRLHKRTSLKDVAIQSKLITKDYEQKHRALPDAKLLSQVYWKLQKETDK